MLVWRLTPGPLFIAVLAVRHKMAPVLSPGKTIEGAVGGLVFARLGCWAAFHWLWPALINGGRPNAPVWGWLAHGLLVGAAGMLGDLACHRDTWEQIPPRRRLNSVKIGAGMG